MILRSVGEEDKCYSFSNLRSLLVSPLLLLFDPELVPHKNALFQGAVHGTVSDMTMLLSLSFSGGDEDKSDADEGDKGKIRTYDLNEEDLQDNLPRLLT